MFGWLKKNKCKHEAVKFETVGLYLRSLTGDMPHYEELLVEVDCTDIGVISP